MPHCTSRTSVDHERWPTIYAAYQAAKQWLESLIPDPHSPDYVDAITDEQFRKKQEAAWLRTRLFMDFLGNPQHAYHTIHVAGTGGKGSVTTMSEAILRHAHERSAAHVSPYVQIPLEKLIIAGRMMPPSSFVAAVQHIQEKYTDFVTYNPDIRPIYGEVWVALTYASLQQHGVTWAAIETSMGGRFDPTNVLNADIAVITNIDYDHIPQLGRTIEEIAWHKAGIIKEGRPVVSGEMKKAAHAVIQAEAKAKKAPLFVLGQDFHVGNIRSSGNGMTMDMVTPFGDIPDLYVNMLGEYQALNAGCAVMACSIARETYGVEVSEQAIRAALEHIEIPGRMEKMQDEPLVILDGAHNPQKMQAAARAIQNTHAERDITLVIGMLATKDALATLQSILPLVHKVVVTEPKLIGKPVFSVEELTALIHRIRPTQLVYLEADIHRAVQRAIDATDKDGLVFISGSIYMLEHVRSMWHPTEALLKEVELELS